MSEFFDKFFDMLKEAIDTKAEEIKESHFKVGDKVICKKSGMSGEIVKLDKEHGDDDEKYYTVKRQDGKSIKYAPDQLELLKEEIEEESKPHRGRPKKKVLDLQAIEDEFKAAQDDEKRLNKLIMKYGDTEDDDVSKLIRKYMKYNKKSAEDFISRPGATERDTD